MKTIEDPDTTTIGDGAHAGAPMNELILRGVGPECMWSHAPGVWYDNPAQAEPARHMEPAEAYTHGLALRTLARGDQLHEIVVHAKLVNNYPLTAAERAWLDARPTRTRL